MSNKPRLFTFGCSYTNYLWPTWADFIGTQYEHYENWGQPGAGNYYIATRLLECHQVNNITKDDVVLVMLSSFTRYDFITRDSAFITSGNIYSQTYIKDGFLEKYWSEEFGFHMTWFCVNSIINLLDKIGCKYKIMTGFTLKKKELDYYMFDQKDRPRVKNGLEYFDDVLPNVNLKEFSEELKDAGESYYEFKLGVDNHPTINMHHEWVKNYLPDFYSEDMLSLKLEWEKHIANNKKDVEKYFSKILNRLDPHDFKKKENIE
jgi:hypothetical protein